LHEYLERILDIYTRTEDFEQLADGFGRFKLHNVLVLCQTTFDVGNETFGHSLVDGCIFNQALLNVANQLTLGDASAHFALGYLVEEL